MIKCEKCGREICHIITNCFQYDGSDIDFRFPLTEHPSTKAISFDANSNWCGYELTEEEQREHILCPYCKQYPFKDKEIQVYNIVQVVMFKENDNERAEID